MGTLKDSLKEALLQTLGAVLSPDQNVRQAAEQQLKALEVTEEYGVHLTAITLDPNGNLGLRQLSSILLKQYVETHWCHNSDNFHPPETTPLAKQQIRQMLPMGLRESISKVRASVAYAISAIASWDWPESWPDLFNILMECLRSGEEAPVHGAMRVLQEFTRDAADQQMPHLVPSLLPEVYRIFKEEEKYGIRTRARAANIFSTIAGMIFSMSEYAPEVKELLSPTLPAFTEALVTALQRPDGHFSDPGLRRDILECLSVLVQGDPKMMSQWMSQILIPVWDTLTRSAETYQNAHVNSLEDPTDGVDSDGMVLGFENLIISIFEFVSGMVQTCKFRKTVKTGVSNLVYYNILYMQITEEQIQKWSLKPDDFVEDEDEEALTFSVRVSAQDLLLELCSEFRRASSVGLCEAITRHLNESQERRNKGDDSWWKIHESCMLALGSVKDLMMQEISNGNAKFDLLGFLREVVLQDLNQNVSPFLLGRCLWVGSRFAKAMNPELLVQFLQATVTGLQESAPITVRICACRSMWNYCSAIKDEEINKAAMVAMLPAITDGLVSLGADHGKEVLSLVLETLSMLIAVDDDFTTSAESKIVSLTIAVFLKYNSDHVIVSTVLDIVKELSRNKTCLATLQHRMVPTLVSILNQTGDKVTPGMQACSVEVIETLVRASTPPLSDILMNSAFPAVAMCTLKTDDHSTMQNGGECMRAFVSVSPEQVYNWMDSFGHSGVWYLVEVCTYLLSPTQADSAAAFVGRLVSVTIAKIGEHMGESLHLLLKAVLSKLQAAKTLTVIQSLIMVYAGLITRRLEAVLDFLSSVPGPNGQPALEFILTEWFSRQHVFHGDYDRKVSSYALTKLLEHAVQTEDSRLTSLTAKGEPIINESESGPKTRSQRRSKPEEWTTIPLLAKIFKLLVNELSNAIEANLATKDDDNTDDEWDEGCDDDDINELMKQPLSSLLADADDYQDIYDVVDDEEDPDCAADPVYSIDLQKYLTQFLSAFSQQPWFATHFSSHLNSSERQVLGTIGVNLPS